MTQIFKVLAAALLWMTVQTADAGRWDADFIRSADQGICKAELARLNRLDRAEDTNYTCSREVLLSYPGFSSLNWQSLRAEEHIDLLNQINLAEMGLCNTPCSDVQKQRRQESAIYTTQMFLNLGGQIRLYRSDSPLAPYNNTDTSDPKSHTESQFILQQGMPRHYGQRSCGVHRESYWINSNTVVKADLSTPESNIVPSAAFALQEGLLVRNEDRILEIGADMIWDASASLGMICKFSFHH